MRLMWKMIFLIAISNVGSIINAQVNLQWGSAFGSTQGWSICDEVAISVSGEVYATGYYQGNVNFNPNGNAEILSSSNRNAFLAKYSTVGNLSWVLDLGYDGSPSVNQTGTAVVLDNNDGVYFIGCFSDSADFDPGPTNTSNYSNTGSEDIFLAKYDSTGTLQWFHTLGGVASGDVPNAAQLDVNGNLVITGAFRGIVDFDPGAGIVNLVSGSSYSTFIVCFDSNGNCLWAKSIGSTAFCISTTIDVDFAGNIVIAGVFTGTEDFDPSSGVYNLTSLGSTDMFLAKYSSIGNLQWAHSFGNNLNNDLATVACDGAGNIVVGGGFLGTIDFDPTLAVFNLVSSPTNTDALIVKYDSSGNLQWGQSFGGTDNDFVLKLITDSSGLIYATGSVRGQVDFDYSSNSLVANSVGDADVYVSIYYPSGTIISAIVTGGSQFDTGYGMDIEQGKIVIGGGFQDSTDLEFGSGASMFYGNGQIDAFVATYDNTTAVPEIDSQNEFGILLYPNPSNGNFNILGNFPEGAKIEVYDVVGQIVYTSELQRGNQSQQISLQLAAGVYSYWVVANDNVLQADKLIIYR